MWFWADPTPVAPAKIPSRRGYGSRSPLTSSLPSSKHVPDGRGVLLSRSTAASVAATAADAGQSRQLCIDRSRSVQVRPDCAALLARAGRRRHVPQVRQRHAQCQSMSDTGRKLFAASGGAKAKPNDADRLKKYLTKFGLSWERLTA